MNPLLLVLAAQVLAGSEVLEHGWYLDLDAQAVSRREEGADLRFLLDGDKGAIVAENGARVAALRSADVDELTKWDGEADKKRLPLTRGGALGLGVKTSKGKRALVRIDFPTNEDAPYVAVTFRYQPDGTGSFPTPPEPPLLEEGEKGMVLRWTAEEGAEHGVFLQEGGAWKLAATVATPEWSVPKIDKGKLLRVRIARKLGDDSWSESVETVVAGTLVGVKSGSVSCDDYRKQGSFSFQEDKEDKDEERGKEDKAERTPDLAFLRDGLAAAAPGGVVHVGRGKKAFRKLRTVPAHGYLPCWRGIEDGDVIAVRLQDGRFAKLLYSKKCWYQHHFTYELLADGGARFPVAPKFKKQSWDEEKGVLTLEIEGAKLANGRVYKVSRGTPSGELEEIGTTAETTFKDAKAPRRTVLVYSIVVKDASGRETSPRQLELDTFPETWTRGEFKLNCNNAGNREGYSFSQQEVMRNGGGDLVLTGAAGGASSLTFSCPKGCWGPERWAGRRGNNKGNGMPGFGELADLDFDDVKAKLEKKKDYQSDERDLGSEVFWVKAGKKSIAQVRITERKYPEIVFEYILIPPE